MDFYTVGQKYTNLALIILIAVIAFYSSCPLANTDFESYKAEFEKSFKNYQSEHDREFRDFLKKDWEEFEVFKAETLPMRPKPAQPPRKKASFNTKLTAPPRMGQSSASSTERLSGFFGHELPYAQYRKIPVPALNKLDNKGIGDAWDVLSKHWQDSYLEQIKELASSFELGDWGNFLLVQQLSSQSTDEESSLNSNQKTLLNWFVMLKIGYQAHLAYDNSKLYLLFPSLQGIYGKPYISLNSTRFYFVDNERKPGNTFSYPKVYSESNSSLDLAFASTIDSSILKETQPFFFQIAGESLKLELSFAPNLVELFRSYPQLDIEHYFRASPSSQLQESLRKEFQQILAPLSQRDAVNTLMVFMHSAFGYLIDQKQFGYEKYLLPDENFAYGFNDCEDRSIIFAWMLREFLDMEVIGLDYPTHIAVAVALDKIKESDHVYVFQDKKYVVADPTYEGSLVGEVMPDLKDVRPKFFQVVSIP